MGRLFILTVIILVLSDKASSDTTFVNGYLEDLTWGIEGSPYVIYTTYDTNSVRIGRGQQLEIEAGVAVLFSPGSYIQVFGDGRLLVHGEFGDSIIFKPLNIEAENAKEWAIIQNGVGGSLSFSFCQFVDAFSDEYGFISVFGGSLFLEDCSFFRIWNKLIHTQPANTAHIDRCLFLAEESYDGVFFMVSNSGHIRNSYFRQFTDNREDGIPFVTLNLIENAEFQICDSYLSNLTLFGSRGLYLFNTVIHGVEQGGVIGGPWGRWDENDPQAYNNCFIRQQGGDNFIGNWPEELGLLDTTNLNGDSCDAYGNIFLDPRIVEGWEWGDEEFLMEDSPCIDAGNPDAPFDPDSTIADIGPFFFSQPNIAVSTDSLTFEETLVGETDTVFFSVRNRGDQKTLLYFIEEDSLAFVFFVDGWLGDTAGVEPGETVEFGLMFQPDSAREYLDTLRIVSNDRDEGVIEIPVRAFGVSSVRGDEEVGRVRSPVLLCVAPNPFNSMLTISFMTGRNAYPPRLGIYDLNGREVFSAVTAPSVTGLTPPLIPPLQAEGGKAATRGGVAVEKVLTWDASAVPTGIYLVRLQAGADVETKKVVLVR